MNLIRDVHQFSPPHPNLIQLEWGIVQRSTGYAVIVNRLGGHSRMTMHHGMSYPEAVSVALDRLRSEIARIPDGVDVELLWLGSDRREMAA
jgi:hypothetical protein